MPPHFNKLDNRTTRIRVRGVTEAALPMLPSHFATFGKIVSWEPSTTASSEVVVQYSARWEAEKAMQRGSSVFGLDDPLILAWEEAKAVGGLSPLPGGGAGAIGSSSSPSKLSPMGEAEPDVSMTITDDDEDDEEDMGEGGEERDWRRAA